MHSASAKEMRFIKIMQQEAYTAQRSQQHNRGSYPNSPQKQYKKVYSIQVCFVELPPPQTLHCVQLEMLKVR